MDYMNLFTDRTRWRKDGQIDSTGAMCLGNKLLRLSPTFLSLNVAGRIVRSLFPERCGIHAVCSDSDDFLASIAAFNDCPETTFEDIQKVLLELQFEMDLHS